MLKEIKKGIVTALSFSVTLGLIGISYASISSLSVSSGTTLTKTLWDNLINEIEPVAVQYTLSADQTVPNGTATILNFANKEYDSHNAVTVGSDWGFYAPKDGLYRVTASIKTGSYTWTDLNSSMWLWTAKNGNWTKLMQGGFIHTSVNTSGTTGGSNTFNLNAGDKLSVGISVWREGSPSIIAADAGQTWVTIERIGDKIN